jgi:hypothetical protein
MLHTALLAALILSAAPVQASPAPAAAPSPGACVAEAAPGPEAVVRALYLDFSPAGKEAIQNHSWKAQGHHLRGSQGLRGLAHL